MLKVTNLNDFYGNAPALHDISIDVKQGEIVTLIGANGAGKSTLMMALSGINKAKSGSIEFCGAEMQGLKPNIITKMGLVQVSQSRNIFMDMKVIENLELGAYCQPKGRPLEEKYEEVFNYFNILRQRKHQRAGFLSGGEQQMLAVARALMSEPKLLLLDEPSEGLAPLIVKQIEEIIKKLRDERGLTTLIAEQNAVLALSVADRGYVLETGQVVASGTTTELENSDLVKKAYLGI